MRTHAKKVGRLVARGAQGVVLGCTVIELLIGPDDVDVPAFPTTALHVAAAVRAALADADGPSAGARREFASGGGPRGPSTTIDG
ncbi:hypothetical protein [Blastococcus capsensis]|uniref:hypothetical protein n=1 Tax=Blastococcus capsensis TaxID=1564163 RepID=UPI002541318C|nr:hypothetical protein [Blastococcus capsensis]MDK3257977.1 hypothetical protein [Blastococcus capsensis]